MPRRGSSAADRAADGVSYAIATVSSGSRTRSPPRAVTTLFGPRWTGSSGPRTKRATAPGGPTAHVEEASARCSSTSTRAGRRAGSSPRSSGSAAGRSTRSAWHSPHRAATGRPATSGSSATPGFGKIPRVQWWRDAVFYQVYVRQFADGDGDGVGDLAGIRARLGYLRAARGRRAVAHAVLPSPMADHGYDVADPRDVDPLFGDLAEFDALVADGPRARHAGHDRPGAQPQLDRARVVPGRAGRRAGQPGARALPTSAPGRGPDGGEPPNNWTSRCSAARPGPGWPDGQWYLHLFAPEQPDLDWTNPEVLADLEKTMRFWLDRGVDGFRIDVAHGMAKPEGLPDMRPRQDTGCSPTRGRGDPRFDQDGVHDVHRHDPRGARPLPGRMAVGEVWVADDERLRPLPPRRTSCTWVQLPAADRPVRRGGDPRRRSSTRWPRWPRSGAPATWVLSNHDVVRARSAATAAARVGRRAGPGDALLQLGPARRGLPLQRRGAGPARRRAARRRAAGPGVGALAGTPSAAGTPAGCRCRGRAGHPATGSPPADAVAADAARVRRADRGRASWRTPARCCRCTGGRWSCAGPIPGFDGRAAASGSAPRTAAWRSAAPAQLVCALNTSGAAGAAAARRRAAGQRTPRRRPAAPRHRGLAGLTPAASGCGAADRAAAMTRARTRAAAAR